MIDLSPHMSMRRFEDIKSYFPQAFADFDKVDPRDANHDPWYMFSKFIAAFNQNSAARYYRSNREKNQMTLCFLQAKDRLVL